MRGAALLTAGQIGTYGLSFARNLILARLLTKADFGLASALAMAVSLLELVTRMSFGTQVIQAREGEEPRFQGAAHTVQLSTGFISALLVLAGAYPMAHTFGVPELTWAFASLALVPLARGSMHLDLARLQRRFRYGPAVLAEIVPQALATTAAWPVVAWLGDFRAVLLIMLGKELLTVAMSHLLAERAYRWAWESHYVRQMLIFGWPLLLNGLVIYASQQGDQMLIGAVFSLSDLGTYSIAFSLTSIPFFVFGQVGSSLMIPALSRLQDHPGEFERQYRRCLELAVLGSLVLLGPLVVAGDPIVRVFYGAKYGGVGLLMAVFAATVALRFFRWAPAVASMSRADTINQFIGNIARTASLPVALLVVWLGTDDMVIVAACGIVGESLSIIVTVLRIWKRIGIGFTTHGRPLLFLVGWLAVGVTVQRLLGEAAALLSAVLAIFGIWVAGALGSLYLFPDLVTLVRQSFGCHRIPASVERR